MKNRIRAYVLLLALCLSLCLIGCNSNMPMDTQPSQTTLPPQTTAATTAPATEPDGPREIYQQWIDGLPQDITMDIETTYEIDVAGFPFCYAASQHITYLGRDTEDFRALVDESLSVGDVAATYSEYFEKGTAYALMGQDKLYEKMDAEDFVARYIPVAMLDASNYDTVTLQGDEVHFADATALEGWLLDEEVQILEAGGTVTMAGNMSATYHATYKVGGSTITVTVTQEFLSSAESVETPKNLKSYHSTESIDGLKLLDYAIGNLDQAQQFSSSTLVSTQSYAAGMIINTQYHINSYVTASGTDYQLETTVYAQDSETTFEQEMKETFINGKYAVTVDDSKESYNYSVTEDSMAEYAAEILYANFLDTGYLTDAEVTNLGSLILIEFTCSEDLGKDIVKDFSETYLGDPDLLNSLASQYTTDKMDYYVALDRYTLLPTACGYLYEGTHTIEGDDYPLIEQLDQSFDLASLSSHDAIYEQPAPDMVPEEKPTPLFYHVTGPDGQEMWLFGTIHVGDDRTAFLPKEIYDALKSSVALAVECDTEGFDKAVEEDDALQSQVSDLYFYKGGTIGDQLDTEDLYEDAVKVMKATGSYFYNSEYLKASLWSSSIDNYYLSQGHQLVSEKGLESRLEKIAADHHIPLWEVESSLFQIKMLTGFSADLQEFQLYSSVYSHGKDNWEGVKDLYELWCKGDEAALIEEMKREVWAFTEEDLEETEDMDEEDLEDLQYIRDNMDSINKDLEKIYNEYIKSMESDRNAGMLEVAKGYLESGDTVFFAVGLAHLIAEDGLVFTLRDAGYTVELVEYK